MKLHKQKALPDAMLQNRADRLRYMFATAVSASIMLLAVYILLGISPFGGNTVLTGDLNSQYISYFSHYKRAFLNSAGFSYGMDKSLGGGLMGLFAYYVSSPLNLLYLLVPVKHYHFVAAFLLFLKIVLACVFFNFFIEHKYPGMRWAGVALALGYGFMSYNFAYAQNIMWHDVMLLLPLLCYSVDKIIQGGRNTAYTIILALAILANFYIAYMVCLFLVVYFVYSMLLQGWQKTPSQTESIAARWKRSAFSFVGGSLLAGGISAALLLPALFNSGQAKGGLFDYTFSTTRTFPLKQLLAQEVWGNFRWENAQNGLPLIYCGLLALLLLACYFISDKITGKEKLLSGGILAFFVLSFWIRGLDEIWHGLKSAVWFPYRNSFLFCFFVLLLAATAVARGAVTARNLLVSAGVAVLGYGLLLVFPQGVSRVKTLLSLVSILVFAALFVLFLRTDNARRKQVFATGVVLVTMLEMGMSGYYITNQFEKYPTKVYTNFIENAGGTVQAIQAADTDDYRIEKNFFRGLNDPMLLGYNGVSHFGSTQDNSTVDILYNLGYRGYSFYSYGSTAFADAVLGIRYVFTAADETEFPGQNRPLPAHYRQEMPLDTAYPVYQNPYALPLAFAMPAENTTNADHENGNSFAYQNALYAAFTDGETLFAPAQLVQRSNNNNELAGEVAPDTSYTVTAQAAGYYYALPLAADGRLFDLPLFINGQEVGRYFTADNQNAINLGWLEEGQTAILSWQQTDAIFLENIWFAYLEPSKLEALQQSALQNSGNFTIRDGLIQGDIQASKGREALFLSIPYDTDWTATVNGAVVPVQNFMGGFMALPLQVGNNTVQLHYTPRHTALAWAITVVSLLLFAVKLLFPLLQRKQLLGLGKKPS